MVIQSSFKDYYDFVAHRYGGGDPKVVYVRGRIKNEFVEMERCNLPNLSQLNRFSTGEEQPLSFVFLIVAAKPYLLSRRDDHAWTGLNGYKLTCAEQMEEISSRRRWHYGRDSWSFLGREEDTLIELSRLAGSPVFIVRRIERYETRKVVQVDELCPILKDLGMASLVPPEQMYQELAYFMGNTMHLSPDVKPPVEVSNRDKILAAGFDLRQSFRHRN